MQTTVLHNGAGSPCISPQPSSVGGGRTPLHSLPLLQVGPIQRLLVQQPSQPNPKDPVHGLIEFASSALALKALNWAYCLVGNTWLVVRYAAHAIPSEPCQHWCAPFPCPWRVGPGPGPQILPPEPTLGTLCDTPVTVCYTPAHYIWLHFRYTYVAFTPPLHFFAHPLHTGIHAIPEGGRIGKREN